LPAYRLYMAFECMGLIKVSGAQQTERKNMDRSKVINNCEVVQESK